MLTGCTCYMGTIYTSYSDKPIFRPQATNLMGCHPEGFDWSCFLMGFWSCCCGAMSCLQQILQICEWILLVQFICFSYICVHHFYPTHTHTLYSVCACLMIALWANRNTIITIIIIIIIISSSSSSVIINIH